MPWWRQHHPRLRRWGKWTGLALALLVVGVGVASVWWEAGMLNASGGVPLLVGGGVVRVQWKEDQRWEDFVGYGPYRHNEQFEWAYWGTGTSQFPYSHVVVQVPLWMPVLILALPTAWLWWSDRPSRRRRLAGCCRTCGYDLAGLGTGAVCPECGKQQARGEEASRRTG